MREIVNDVAKDRLKEKNYNKARDILGVKPLHVLIIALVMAVKEVLIWDNRSTTVRDILLKDEGEAMATFAIAYMIVAAVVFDLLFSFILVKYYSLCNKSAIIIIALLIADPFTALVIKNAWWLTSGIVMLTGVLIIPKYSLTTKIYVTFAALAFAATLLFPGAFFCFVPALLSVYYAEMLTVPVKRDLDRRNKLVMLVTVAASAAGGLVSLLLSKQLTNLVSLFFNLLVTERVKMVIHNPFLYMETWWTITFSDFGKALFSIIPVVAAVIYFGIQLKRRSNNKRSANKYEKIIRIMTLSYVLPLLGAFFYQENATLITLNFVPVFVVLVLLKNEEKNVTGLISDIGDTITARPIVFIFLIVVVAASLMYVENGNTMYRYISQFTV